MVDDILDKIVVPNGKSSKGDVFKKEKKEEKEEKHHKEEETKPKIKHHIYKKKEIFRKREFPRKTVSFNIKQPGLIERGIYIALILILFYFALFQNININFDFGDIFGGDVQPLVVKEETETTEETTTEETETTETEETELSGEVTLTIDGVITEKYDTGVSKITGFTFTINNQKEEFDGKLLYYGYDSNTPAVWITKERGDKTYTSIPIGSESYNIDTSIVFTNTYDKTMRFELIDFNSEETIANITKEVTIS